MATTKASPSSFEEGFNGVLATVVASSISLVSVLAFILYMAFNGYTAWKRTQNLFPGTHVFPYLSCLLVADVMKALGIFMSARWLAERGITNDWWCTAQAVIKHTGNVGTAFWSCVISAHMFNLLFRIYTSRRSVYVVVCTVWAFIAFLVLLGPIALHEDSRGPWYGSTGGHWCWITVNYAVPRFVLEYLAMGIAAILSLVIYSIVLLRLRGNLYTTGARYKFRFISSEDAWHNKQCRDAVDTSILNIIRRMIWFPIAYTVLALPNTVARLRDLHSNSDDDGRFSLTAAGGFIFTLSGFVNVVLFFITKRVITDAPVDTEAGNSNHKGDTEHGDYDGKFAVVALKRYSSTQPMVSDAQYIHVRSPSYQTYIQTPADALHPKREFLPPFLNGAGVRQDKERERIEKEFEDTILVSPDNTRGGAWRAEQDKALAKSFSATMDMKQPAPPPPAAAIYSPVRTRQPMSPRAQTQALPADPRWSGSSQATTTGRRSSGSIVYVQPGNGTSRTTSVTAAPPVSGYPQHPGHQPRLSQSQNQPTDGADNSNEADKVRARMYGARFSLVAGPKPAYDLDRSIH